MKKLEYVAFLSFLLSGVLLILLRGTDDAHSGIYRHAAVAADSAECSRIGVEILRKGGTAVDAAVAGLLCSGVANPQSAGIGGGGFMVYYNATSQESAVIDFRERAPWNITKYNDANSSTESGGLAIAVPGELLGMEYAWKRFGRLEWRELIQPTIDLTKSGFKVSSPVASVIQSLRAQLDTGKYPGLEKLLKPNGALLKEGGTIKMTELSMTLEKVAEHGSQYFYNSSFTKEMVMELQRDYGSVLTVKDFNDYSVTLRKALISDYHDLQLIGVPPPGGGAMIALVLNILEGYNFTERDFDWHSYHRMVEAFKFGFAQRMKLGDPDFNATVKQTLQYMLQKSTAESMRSRISDHATYSPSHYEGNLQYSPLGKGTAHVSVLAENGDAVAATSSINTFFGSLVRLPGNGIIFNNQMNDFSVKGKNSLYGFPPSEVNYIESRKTPQSSTAPTIVTRDGRVVMVTGGSGGSRIPTATIQVMLNVFNFGMQLRDAVPAPRIHHQLLPDKFEFEPGFPRDFQQALSQVHNITVAQQFEGATVQAIYVAEDGRIHAASDPRTGGRPSGY